MDRDFSDLSALPKKIAPIALTGRGVMRAGMEVYKNDKLVGWLTSRSLVPYFKTQGEGISTVTCKPAASVLSAWRTSTATCWKTMWWKWTSGGQAGQGGHPRPAHERGRSSLCPSPHL